jgi:preprotein translocase subunit SecG
MKNFTTILIASFVVLLIGFAMVSNASGEHEVNKPANNDAHDKSQKMQLFEKLMR